MHLNELTFFLFKKRCLTLHVLLEVFVCQDNSVWSKYVANLKLMIFHAPSNGHHWLTQSFKKYMYCELVEVTLLGIVGTMDKMYSEGTTSVPPSASQMHVHSRENTRENLFHKLHFRFNCLFCWISFFAFWRSSTKFKALHFVGYHIM